MVKQIDLEEDWTPDKFKDDLSQRRWKESGATTTAEFLDWCIARQRKLQEAVEASGMGYIDYILAERKAKRKLTPQASG
jgi:hypothetical protein